MTREKTYALYVNLSASQARKRLRGHGFGVRRVEASDRNQSVIIHTATGSHLRDLRALFADTVTSESRGDLDVPVENLRNLGSSTATLLREIGVQTKSNLQETGPVKAYRLIKRNHPGTSIKLLFAMAAAIADTDVRELSKEEIANLRAEIEA